MQLSVNNKKKYNMINFVNKPPAGSTARSPANTQLREPRNHQGDILYNCLPIPTIAVEPQVRYRPFKETYENKNFEYPQGVMFPS